MKTLGAATLALGATSGTDAAPTAAQTPVSPVRFGVDMYSLGAQEMDAVRADGLRREVERQGRALQRDPVPGHPEPDHLRKVRAYADKLGLDLEIGMRSICPTSAAFDKAQGTAEEQLGRMVDAADRPLAHRAGRARQQCRPPHRD